MNILITGANGQLGNEMRIVSLDAHDRFIFTDINNSENTSYLDITDLTAVRNLVQKENIDIIVNCAAYTNVDAAESNEPLAEKLNATAPKNLAIAMAEVEGLLIHISTDYVFGKEPYNKPCTENQKGTPTGIYGKTKLHGEENIIETGCKYVIIRTAWLYSEFGKNFLKTMLQLTASKPSIKVVFDQVGTPTYALDLAEAINVIINEYKKSNGIENKWDKNGIYHFSNEGVCSWFDFTKMIAHYAGRKGKCEIQPCHSDEFPSPVKRPSFSVLDKTKIKQTFGIKVPYWTDSLEKCLKNMI